MWLVGVQALTTPLVLPYSDHKEQPQSLCAGEDPHSSAHSISWEGLLPVKLSLLQSAGLGLANLMTWFWHCAHDFQFHDFQVKSITSR